ncbi:dihydroxyacetone kinase subunit DhaK [Aureibacter tunicatorum]|uniref:Dihydroxyacetone kinase-like protein n=1 Tax=Aureibacter tunicatorum TaxID=866807 RepID=A0AAE4BUH1_9BACT|nr:dihydroxyacetone kinase subunit DhaK [Aureibacter tunicatorum]MDR6241781.1 dihydroxyacetone kinase-like protein [Aureibacter tunicatorum]BDD07427.1 dihydroxyacetone kinase subunit DhaK [Aureibacter tunicatorum]
MSEIAERTIQKFINNPENLTAELLEGYTLAYKDQVKMGAENIVVRVNAKAEDKVAVISLGGSGHEPAISGFVGDGMLDASVVGDIFAAPGAPRVLEALRMFKRDAGVLLVVLNHAGDVMAANMAVKLAEREGIKVKTLLTHDDISAGIDADKKDRRGLGGCVAVFKAAGAAAEQGKSLDEVYEVTESLNKNIATLAVAMKSCTHPQNGAVIAELPEGIMEIGMGQHGEGGGGRFEMLSADETATRMAKLLIKKLNISSGDKVFAYINGVGATTYMELMIVFRKVHHVLEELGAQVVESKVSEILTVQEMAGFQMIMGKVEDEHVKLLKDCSSNAPYWTVLGKK